MPNQQFESVDDFFAHHGVKGMKWGVRRAEKKEAKAASKRAAVLSRDAVLVTKLKNGGELRVIEKTQQDRNFLARKLVKEEELSGVHEFMFADKHGNKVGEASFYQEPGSKTLDLEWIGVKKTERRKGYARAAMKGVIKYAQDNDLEKLELRATDMGAPLYESLGFKPVGQGLTSHHVFVVPPKKTIKHGDLDVKSLAEYIAAAIDAEDDFDDLSDDLKHSNTEKAEAFIKHYGKKGMKWGVVNEDDLIGRDGAAKVTAGGQNGSKKEESPWSKVELDKPSPKQFKKNMLDSHKKFYDKADPSNANGDAKPGMSPATKKALITLGVYAAIGTALVIAGNQMAKTEALDGLDPKSAAGKFKIATLKSKSSWGKGYVTKVSHAREEFELPIGHTFHRLSTGLEDSFNNSTYATHSIEDFNRYVTAFRGEKGSTAQFFHVTFKANEPIRVPNLKTTLDTLKEVMDESGAYGGKATSKQVLEAYSGMSGGSWTNSPGGFSKPLFEALSKKGYGAIVDEMDANVIGESPIVMFAKEKLSAKVAEALSSDQLKAAEDAVLDFANRK